MVKYQQVFVSRKRNHNINVNKPNLNLKYVVIIGFPSTYSLSPHCQVSRSVAGRWKCLPALCIITTYCAFRGCGLEHVYCLTAPCRLRCPSCHYLLSSVWFQPLWSEKEGRRQVIPFPSASWCSDSGYIFLWFPPERSMWPQSPPDNCLP